MMRTILFFVLFLSSLVSLKASETEASIYILFNNSVYIQSESSVEFFDSITLHIQDNKEIVIAPNNLKKTLDTVLDQVVVSCKDSSKFSKKAFISEYFKSKLTQPKELHTPSTSYLSKPLQLFSYPIPLSLPFNEYWLVSKSVSISSVKKIKKYNFDFFVLSLNNIINFKTICLDHKIINSNAIQNFIIFNSKYRGPPC